MKTFKMFCWCLVLTVFVQFSNCKVSKIPPAEFVHQTNGKVAPWSHERFDNDNDKFCFAIISDLYGGERPGIFKVAINQINLLHPEFIMSVGDLIDGGTEDKNQLSREWNEFDNKAALAHAPVFYAGGNHDLTNVVMREVWAERYGPRYYHFVYKDVLFLVLDSEDYEESRMDEIYKARAVAIDIMDGKVIGNAATSEYFKMPERRTGRISPTQSSYFKNVIEDNPNVKWTFLFMHKPVWMREDGEGLSSIEKQLKDQPYTVFNGHFHTYSHTLDHEQDYIMLGTTGGSQNDQSDMAFDHFTIVTMTKDGPSIANLRLDGVLDKIGKIPGVTETMCFQSSKCKEDTTSHSKKDK